MQGEPPGLHGETGPGFHATSWGYAELALDLGKAPRVPGGCEEKGPVHLQAWCSLSLGNC